MSSPFGAMSGPFVGNQKPAEFVIMPLDDSGREDTSIGGKKILQYWPQSISTSQEANWQASDIPGCPLPIYQWTSGSEHSLSFVATFSRDMDGDVIDENKYNVDIEAAIAWLRMLSINSYVDVANGKVAKAPPTLWLYLQGTFLGANSAANGASGASAGGLYCKLRGVSPERITWFQSGKTRYANVSLSFFETMQIAGNIFPFSRDDFLPLANLYTRRPS